MTDAIETVRAVESAERQIWASAGFFLLMSAGIALVVLAGLGPVPPLLLTILGILALLNILSAIEQREVKGSGVPPTDLEEFRYLIGYVGLAAAMGLVTCGVYALAASGGGRTGTTALVCVLVLGIALISFGQTKPHSDRRREQAH